MPTREQVNYFGAGPAPLPTSVLEDAAKVILNYNDMGIGITEISHRSPQANQVLADAKNGLIQLLNIPDDYEILFLQGGGSGEFSAVVYHLVAVWVERLRTQLELWRKSIPAGDKTPSKEELDLILRQKVKDLLRLDYLVTGSWSLKASKEAARLMGAEYVNIALDSRKSNSGKFGKIPDETTWNCSQRSASTENGGNDNHGFSWIPEVTTPAFTYYCDNETVDGVEFPGFPDVLLPNSSNVEPLVVADMSSNFLSRKIDVKKFAVIFGGAQKNIGTTGVTIVIMRKSLLPPTIETARPEVLRQLGLSVGPVVLDWSTIAINNSLYNTLPIFDVWIAGQVMKRLCETYGAQRITGQEEISDEKARMIYNTLDKYSSIYQVVPDVSVRSRMNICLRIKNGDADAEKAFISGAETRFLTGLKGHRSVGGIRISNYNAVTLAGVKKLVQYLIDFAEG